MTRAIEGSEFYRWQRWLEARRCALKDAGAELDEAFQRLKRAS
jgi:hypothetical protein